MLSHISKCLVHSLTQFVDPTGQRSMKGLLRSISISYPQLTYVNTCSITAGVLFCCCLWQRGSARTHLYIRVVDPYGSTLHTGACSNLFQYMSNYSYIWATQPVSIISHSIKLQRYYNLVKIIKWLITMCVLFCCCLWQHRSARSRV